MAGCKEEVWSWTLMWHRNQKLQMHNCNSPSRTSLVMTFFWCGDDWGSRGLFCFYFCWEEALFIFLFFVSSYFLGCFQMFGLYQLAFLLHDPSSSFPSTIHDPRSRSLWIASVLRPCWVKLWGGRLMVVFSWLVNRHNPPGHLHPPEK